MVDKPGRRKRSKRPWGKVAAAAVVALVVVAAGYYVYENYVYKAPPVFAVIGTSFGKIDIELFPACAPQTVSNFVNLSRTGFYSDLVWHRLVYSGSSPDFVIQTGDPNTRNGVNGTRSTWGQGGTKHTVPLEWCGWLHNYAGYLGMARGQDPNSGSSQFYINLSNGTANQNLDTSYTVFGRVLSGMGVVCQIARVKTYSSTATQNGVSIADQPIAPVFMKNVTILAASPVATPAPLTSC